MMKTRLLSLIVLALLLAMGTAGCKKDDPNPDDYVTSVLTGEYGTGQFWSLSVTENGTPLTEFGYVRFQSATLQEAKLIFHNVIPGVARKEYNKVPLTAGETGYLFTIEDVINGQQMTIAGSVTFGAMTVDITTE